VAGDRKEINMDEKITRCIEKIREEQNFHREQAEKLSITAVVGEDYYKWLRHMTKADECGECILLIMEVVMGS